MKIVIFGLSVSSSWGNGHATLWRGLLTALAAKGHRIDFFELDTPYYAAHRDTVNIPGCTLHIYHSWAEIRDTAFASLRDADVSIVTSYCPDARIAFDLMQSSNIKRTVFYDLDTPITLENVKAGKEVAYLPSNALRDFDLTLSYTGGDTLQQLKTVLGAKRVAPLYGSVDMSVHRPVSPIKKWQADLSYLGTYASSRQRRLEAFLIEPAVMLPEQSFLVCGAQFPQTSSWPPNIRRLEHAEPSEHAALYSSSRFTLNITRREMAQAGYCPSGRLFEAAACGCPVISDSWEGLEHFFDSGDQILVATSTADVLDHLQLSEAERSSIATRAQQRVLDCHTAERRATELAGLLQSCLESESPIVSEETNQAVCGA